MAETAYVVVCTRLAFESLTNDRFCLTLHAHDASMNTMVIIEAVPVRMVCNNVSIEWVYVGIVCNKERMTENVVAMSIGGTQRHVADPKVRPPVVGNESQGIIIRCVNVRGQYVHFSTAGVQDLTLAHAAPQIKA